ncbi:MAG: cyclic lactone autoinducer peptide [Oscillospiraceae bacterium]|nr:cyclic lactone autoinducer peptide [Oscillospiraceae bacterium]
MKAKKVIANALAKVTRAMAVKSCGAASAWGSYQPDESKVVKILKK